MSYVRVAAQRFSEGWQAARAYARCDKASVLPRQAAVKSSLQKELCPRRSVPASLFPRPSAFAQWHPANMRLRR